MLVFALGPLRLLPDVFWSLTWSEFECIARGYQLQEAREWERTRALGEWNASFAGVDLKKELGHKRLIELPTDASPLPKFGGKVETEAEFYARMKAAGFYLNQSH